MSFGEREMATQTSNTSEGVGDIAAGGIALATLIVADKVTLLHPLFGLPLFIYLSRHFKKHSSLSERLIVSMAMSFVTLLFTCYFIQLILDKSAEPPEWDIVLAIQWFIVFPLAWAVREMFELTMSRGKT